jgi:hypothetical protein
MMPADYGTTLDSNQLNDLISFLITVAQRGKPPEAKVDSEPMDEAE